MKKAHLLGPTLRVGTPPASPLAAAYLQYAWIPRWVPRLRRAALHPDLFEQPGRKRVPQHPPTNALALLLLREVSRSERLAIAMSIEG